MEKKHDWRFDVRLPDHTELFRTIIAGRLGRSVDACDNKNMTMQEIEELKKLLQRLEAEDKNLRVFGASSHNHKLRPTLSESELQEFEQRHQVKLPEAYRFFWLCCMNGWSCFRNDAGVN